MGRPTAEISNLANETERPMRWASAERVAKKYSLEILKRWEELEKQILSILPDPVSYDEARKDCTPDYSLLIPHECGCMVLKRAFTEQDYLALQNVFMDLMGSEFTAKFNEAFESAFNDYMTGNGNVEFDGAIFNRFYHDTYQDALNHTYNVSERQIDIQFATERDRELWRANISTVEGYGVVQSSPFVQSVYQNGFQLIKNKVTIQFYSLAMQSIVEGVQAGDDWLTIARNLHKRAGVGAGWQWKRLVRTEMTIAQDKANKEMFGLMDVQYSRYSYAMGACPICVDLGNRNQGYYPTASRPTLTGDTHPNCRCNYIPIFNLPNGISF